MLHGETWDACYLNVTFLNMKENIETNGIVDMTGTFWNLLFHTEEI